MENDIDRVRSDWTREEIRALIALPFPDLVFRAQSVHRRNFDPARIQLSTLLSIKTGGCPEDCAYCPQSIHYETGVDAAKLMGLDDVLAEAREAARQGATRFCMGAAWREPKDRDLDAVCAMIEGVKRLGLESCATLGMLTAAQARRLGGAGLDFYNHNLDSSPEYYERDHHHAHLSRPPRYARPCPGAGIKVCCGGIVGMGESREDRVGMIHALATLPFHPESVPINLLVRVAGTPLGDSRAARCARIRAHNRRRAHDNAALGGAALRRARRDDGRGAGAVFSRRRQLDLLRPAPADDAQSRARA